MLFYMSNQSTSRLYVEVYNARRERDATPRGSAAFEAANQRVAQAFAAIAQAQGR